MKEKRQFWKSEINIPINSSVKEASDFLSNIGFREVARVSKKREKFSRGRFEIVLDKVDQIGDFLEVECKVDSQENINKFLRKNLDIIQILGLEKCAVIDQPYRDLVIDKMRNTQG